MADGNTKIPVQTEVEVIDQVADQSIVEMMTGQAIQDYVYSFKQGSRVVEGLTLAGINEASNRRGGIQVEKIDYRETPHSWIATAEAIDTVTGSSRYGAYEQAKKIDSRSDPFAFTKAIHKAQRNAIKQLIPVPVIREVLNFYLNRSTAAPDTQAETEESATDNITNAQKAAFAIAANLKARLKKADITDNQLWDYVKRTYKVASRNDMTEQQWTELAAEFRAAETTPVLFEELKKRILTEKEG